MRLRSLIATGLIAACATAALVASAAAADGTKSKVTIEAQTGGFFGYVHSSDSSCESGRKVVLYKQKGSEQKPSKDVKIGTDIAQPNGPDSMWSINTAKQGNFYAKVGPTASCQKDLSDTVPSQS